MAIRTVRSKSAFETYSIWDDTVPWGRLVGKYIVDGNGRVRAVRRVNFTKGTVTFKDGEEVPGWVIDQDFSSLHSSRDEADHAADTYRLHRSTSR